MEVFKVEGHVSGVVVYLFEISLDDGVFIGVGSGSESGEGSRTLEIGRRGDVRIDRVIQVDCFTEIVL